MSACYNRAGQAEAYAGEIFAIIVKHDPHMGRRQDGLYAVLPGRTAWTERWRRQSVRK